MISSIMPVSLLFLPCAPHTHMRFSDDALPPSMARSCISTTFIPLLAAAIAQHTPAMPPPTTHRSAQYSTVFIKITLCPKIIIQFYHCKYSHGEIPGARVADLYEVCGQAEKSIKWCQEPVLVIDRLIRRENARGKHGATRIEIGSLNKLKEIKNKMKVYPTKFEISIVQPGIDKEALSDDMIRILSGTASQLMDTYGIELQVICS